MQEQQISARFVGTEDAQRAAVALERLGVDDSYITVRAAHEAAISDKPPRNLHPDKRKTREFKTVKNVATWWAGTGAAVGVGLGAVAGIVAFVVSSSFIVTTVAVICAAITGFLLGGFYGTAANLPTGEEAEPTASYPKSSMMVVSVKMTDPVLEQVDQDRVVSVFRSYNGVVHHQK